MLPCHPHRGVLFIAAIVWLSGCKGDTQGAQVCSRDDSGALRLIEVFTEDELMEYVDRGEPFGAGFDQDCRGGVSFVVDPAVEPTVRELSGVRGGSPRPVAALRGPRGTIDHYVADEIEIRFESTEERDRVLRDYRAVVVRDDTVSYTDEAGNLVETPGGMNGWHLVRIDPEASSLLDLPREALRAGVEGALRFSSTAAIQTLAAALREKGTTPNFVGELHTELNEHPLNSAGTSFVDWSQQWWMTEDDDPMTPGDQGVSVGVAAAFDYLRDTGLPPRNGVWRPARVALVDTGFALDPDTGLGSLDYNNNDLERPLQVDLIDYDVNAGGPNTEGGSRWHGEDVFAIAAAYPRNAFGGAGTGGEYVRPIVIRVSLDTSSWAAAIRSAALMQADVINLSVGSTCPFLCGVPEFFAESHLQEEVITATTLGSIVVTSAGNGPNNSTPDWDMDDGDVQAPCEMSNVICVGAINTNAANVWNYGSAVDIWAPTSIWSTAREPFISSDGGVDDHDIDELNVSFGGTSCSSPFVAGVLGLMRASKPDLRWDDALAILQDTGNAVLDPIVAPGSQYVDAFRAVAAVRENPAPTVDLIAPDDGDTISWYSERRVVAEVADPMSNFGFRGTVEFVSDVQGTLCTLTDSASRFSCEAVWGLGPHTVTAVASDEGGATTTSAPANIEVINWTPNVSLVSPTGGTLYADQIIPFRANVSDRDFEPYRLQCPAPTDEACVEWRSSRDGVLVPTGLVGEPTNFSTMLSQGIHEITVLVRDGKGAEATDSATVTVFAGAGLPSAVIETPNLPNRIDSGWLLRGRGSDPEDGVLTGASLRWTSSIDGLLGAGQTLIVELTAPDKGEQFLDHVVTLTARDSDGNTATDQIIVRASRID